MLLSRTFVRQITMSMEGVFRTLLNILNINFNTVLNRPSSITITIKLENVEWIDFCRLSITQKKKNLEKVFNLHAVFCLLDCNTNNDNKNKTTINCDKKFRVYLIINVRLVI